jgi:hypothetical protein
MELTKHNARVPETKITAPLPDGWFFKESITLLAPDGRANVIASSEPLSPEIDLARYAGVQGELLRTEFSGYRELALEVTKAYKEYEGILRTFEWSPDEKPGEPVRQIQLYCVINGRGYTATATAPLSEFQRFQLYFGEILEGLRIE